MADYEYDLFTIGAGSGGVRASRIAGGEYGAKVGIAEEYRYGGTCVIRGCVPKKMLVYASMSYETIKVEREGPLTIITLNRPERLNAMPPQMADEIGEAFYDLGDSRAVLITGEGKGFCSGADLAARGENNALGSKGGSHQALSQHYNPAISQLIRAEVPVICAVNGPAAGVGCSLALAADFTIASKSAYFLQAFVNIGLVPDGGSTWLLARAVGRARATRMMMLGEKIGGEQAEEWGLVYKCVDDADLMAEAKALATKLANGPTLAYKTMKRNIATALDNDLNHG